jgi:hypothetical protein
MAFRFSLKGRIHGPTGIMTRGFVNNTVINESDILQLFGSLTLDNVGERIANGLAFRSYDHGFRRRRYIARDFQLLRCGSR